MDSGSGDRQGLDLSDIMSMLEEDSPKKAVAKKPKEQPKVQQETPVQPAVQSSGKDNALISKLLSDIEQKNAEILKLNSDNLDLKYEAREKEMELKKAASELEEAKKSLEETSKKLDEANARLGEMDADRAKLKLKVKPSNDGDAAEEAPSEEDVASIFKRLTKSELPPAEEDPLNVNPDKPRPPKKTAKLYDL